MKGNFFLSIYLFFCRNFKVMLGYWCYLYFSYTITTRILGTQITNWLVKPQDLGRFNLNLKTCNNKLLLFFKMLMDGWSSWYTITISVKEKKIISGGKICISLQWNPKCIKNKIKKMFPLLTDPDIFLSTFRNNYFRS